MRDFFGCYLLLSLAPEGHGRTYIGFTVNPRRRIRQHNGLIKAGAWKTSRGRPWEMTLVLYGFPTKIQALQFEWAWQHPLRSLIVRPIAQALGSKKLQGVRGKVLLMLSMLHESPWRHFPLTLQYLDPKYAALVKESVASAPSHIRVFTAPMEDLPRVLDDLDGDDDERGGVDGEEPDDRERQAGEGDGSGKRRGSLDGSRSGDDINEAGVVFDVEENGSGGEPVDVGADGGGLQQTEGLGPSHEGRPHGRAPTAVAAVAGGGASNACVPCHICQVVIQRHILVCSVCGVTFHLGCLAARWSSAGSANGGGGGGDRFGGVPEQGHCPACETLHSWMGMLRGMQTIGWGNKPRGRRGRQPKSGGTAAAQAKNRTAAAVDVAAAVVTVLTGPGPKARKRAAKPKGAAAAAQSGDQDLQELAFDTSGDLLTGPSAPQNLSNIGLQPHLPTKQRRKTRTDPSDGTGKVRRRAPECEDGAGACPVAPAATEGLSQLQDGGVELTAPATDRPQRAAPRPRAAKRAAKGGQVASALTGQADAGVLPVCALEVFDDESHASRAASRAEPLLESPSKRQRRGRKPPPPSQDAPASLRLRDAASARALGNAELGVPDGADGTCDSRQDVEAREPSPVPLWRRLQARTGVGTSSGFGGSLGLGSAGAAKGPRVLSSAAAAAMPDPRRVIVLADALSSSSSGSEQEEKFCNATGSGRQELCGNLEAVRRLSRAADMGAHCTVGNEGCGRRAALVATLPKAELDNGLGHDPPLVDRPEQDSMCPLSPRRRQASLLGLVRCLSQHGQEQQPQQVLPDMVILGTSSDETESEGLGGRWAGRCGADGWDLAASSPAASLQSPPAVRQAQVAAAVSSQSDAARELGPAVYQLPCSPMDASPQRHGARGRSVNVAPAQVPTYGTAVGELRLGAADEPIGSPAFGSPFSGGTDQLGPPPPNGLGSTEAAGSAGSGLAALLSQLQCSRLTSPTEEQLREAGMVSSGTCNDRAAPSTSMPPSAVRPVTLSGLTGAACDAAAHSETPTVRSARPGQRQPGCELLWSDTVDGTRASLGGSGGVGQKLARVDVRPPAREVVDLCTPLPLRSRLASHVVEITKAVTVAEGAGGACEGGERAEHMVGKRLRSPKPPLASTTFGGSGGNFNGGGCNGSGSFTIGALAVSGAQPAPAATAATAVATRKVVAAAETALSDPLVHYGIPQSGGWSVSPWPLRRRCASPAPAVREVGGDLERLQGACVGGIGMGQEDLRGMRGAVGSAPGARDGGRRTVHGDGCERRGAPGRRRAAGLQAGGGKTVQQRASVRDTGSDDGVVVID